VTDRADPFRRLPLRRLRVRGASMSPTLSPGDVVLVHKVHTPKPGDVVVVTWPHRPGQLSVKRALYEAGGGWHVVGDLAAHSTDSRVLGPATVHGVVLARLWPRPARLSR